MVNLNRRHILSATAAGAAASVIPRSAFAAERSNVLILGAGLAGLYAADFLRDQGVDVTVLEAKSEPGGRTKSVLIDGESVNLGGNEIGSDYGRMIALAGKYGLELTKSEQMGYPTNDINIDGTMIAAKDWAKSNLNKLPAAEREILPHLLETRLFYSKLPFRGIDDWLKPENAHLDISQYEYLKAAGVSDTAISYIDQFALSTDTSRTSALSVFRDAARFTFTGFDGESSESDALGSNVGSYTVNGGTQKVCKAMANSLGDQVRYNEVVSRIEHSNSGISVSTLSGSRYSADFLIIAIPLTALSRISISPNLPEVQRRGIENARYAGGVQIHCRLNSKKLTRDGFEASFISNGPIERLMTIPGVNGESDRAVIWVNGLGANRIDQLPEKDVSSYIMQAMKKARPSSEGALEFLYQYSWSRDPFAGGIRYVYGPGEASSLGPVINKRMGRIILAGEHARINDLGMEGALESGFNAVLSILQATK